MSVARDPRRRREIAAKAGRISGARRRALAKGRRAPHCRDQAQALALAYRVRQARATEVRARYEKLCGELGIRVSERGYKTFLAEYRSEWRAYRARGQDYQTTNGARARALTAQGRPRCARTVRRTRQRLALAGLVAYEHVRRQRARAGFRDTLRVRVLSSSFVPLPSAARAGGATPLLPALASTAKALIAPPTGGRDRPPGKPAVNGSDERRARLENRRIADLLQQMQQLTLALEGDPHGTG